MKYPKNLSKNNTIELVTPSFGCKLEPYFSRYHKSCINLEKLSYTIKKNIYNLYDISFDNYNKKDRANEFINAYKNKDSHTLISVGGGEFMYSILEYIDFDLLKILEPKWFMGYSDNTILTFLLPILCDVVSVYGPCFQEFGSNTLNQIQLDSIDMLCGKTSFKGYTHYETTSIKDSSNPYANYNLDTPKKLTKYPNENFKIEGRLIGGCLDVLTLITGTMYDKVNLFNEKYKKDGFIWFIENCELNVAAYYRELLHLKNAGWFKYVTCFLIGRTNTTPCFSLDKYSAVLNVLQSFNVPIVFDCDFGHVKPMLPIMCGAYCKISVGDNIEFEYIKK